MQPLNWDTAARTPLTDALSLYIGPDALRPPASESFGDHLYRSDSAPPYGASHEIDTSRPDWRAEQQPPPSSLPGPLSPSPPEKHVSPPAEDVNHAAADHDPSQSVDSSAQPAATQNPSSESSAANDEPRGRPVDTGKRDSKSSTETRDKAASRRLATAINGDAESTNLTADAETLAKTKRVGALSGKSKAAAKGKQNGRLQQPSGQPDSVTPSATHPADGTRLTEVTPDEQTARQSTAVSATDGSFNAVEQTSTNDAGTAQPRQLIAETISADPSTRVEDADVDRSTRVGKRGHRASRDERGVDALASAGNSPSSEHAPETIAALKQIDESSAQTDSVEALAVTESGKARAPATSAPQGSAPTSPQMRFAQHLAVKSGGRAAKTSPLTDLEHSRLVDRVARAFHTAEARGGTVTLRLHPPELGALRVELRVIDGALSARLEVETPTARTVLLDNVQMLHDRLAEQGVRIERFDVDLLDRRSAGDSPGFEHQGPRDQDNRQPPTADASGHETRESESTRPNPRPNATGKLNVVV